MREPDWQDSPVRRIRARIGGREPRSDRDEADSILVIGSSISCQNSASALIITNKQSYHTIIMVARKKVCKEVLREHPYLAFDSVVEHEACGDGRAIQSPPPPPLPWV